MKRKGRLNFISCDVALRMSGSALVATGFLTVFSSMSGCKDPIEPRRSTPTATPAPASTLNPLSASEQRCNDTANYQCNIPSDLVTLCKEKEPTNSMCSDAVWTKALYQKIVDIQKAGDASLASCPSETWYVNTKTDPLKIRQEPKLSGTILGEADRGESVKCIGLSLAKEEGEWMKVKSSSGQEGFMKKEYLATTAPSGTSGTAGGKPGTPQAVAGSTGICIKPVFDKQVPQNKPSGGCASLEGTPHKGFWGGTHEGQTLVGCYEEKTNLLFWGCKCTVRRIETQAVDPGKSCPPGFKPR